MIHCPATIEASECFYGGALLWVSSSVESVGRSRAEAEMNPPIIYIVNYTDTFDGTSWDDEQEFTTFHMAVDRADEKAKGKKMFTARVFAKGTNAPCLYLAGSY